MNFVSMALNDDELEWCKNHACEIVEYYGGQGSLRLLHRSGLVNQFPIQISKKITNISKSED